MTTVRTIADRGAVLAWSPVKELGDFLAVGTKEGGGGGFEDYGGDLSIYAADLSSAASECRHVCRVKTASRFCSLAWTAYTPQPAEGVPAGAPNAGLLAGGMADGTIIVWDVGRLLSGDGEQAMLTVIERQAAPVRALQFNPHPQSRHLLAAGSSDGDIKVVDLSTPSAPTLATPLTSGSRLDHEITSVAWNTSVPHILATATLGGVVVVWDLKEHRVWCILKDPYKAAIADVAWHPEDGLFLATACDDDARPVLRVWDLRSSTSVPLAELSGHTKGVVSLDWCPSDPTFLLSCGKDGHTFIWDVGQEKAVADIPSGAPAAGSAPAAPTRAPPALDALVGGGVSAAGVFGAPPGTDAGAVFGTSLGGMGGIGASAGRRYLVRWSKKCPAYFAACSFDRRVTIHSAAAWGPDMAPRVPGAYGAPPESNMRRAPRWLKRPVGASFAFGGKLLTFGTPPVAAQSNLRSQGTAFAKVLQLCKTSTDLDFTSQAASFEGLVLRLNSGEYDVHVLCTYLAGVATSSADPAAAALWSLLAAVSSPDPRPALLSFLGFNAGSITAELGSYAAASAAGLHRAAEPDAAFSHHRAPLAAAGGHPPSHAQAPSAQPEYASFSGGFGGHSEAVDADALFGGPGSVASAEDFFGGGGGGSEHPPHVHNGREEGGSTSEGGDHSAHGAQERAAAADDAYALHAQQPVSEPASSASPGIALLAPRYGERVVTIKGAPEDDSLLRRALVVGDFSAAVSVCLTQGRLDDALLLASAGSPELWEQTKEECFARKAAAGSSNVMAAVVPHVLKGSLRDMVSTSSLPSWRETLALACTYAKPEEFAGLACALGERLLTEVGDTDSATVCFMASPVPDRAVTLLVHRMEEQSRVVGRQTALLSFAQVVIIFRRVAAAASFAQQQEGVEPVQAEAPYMAALAQLLADEGALPTAAMFAAQIGPTAPVGIDGLNVGDVVRDRLLRAFDGHEYAFPSAVSIQAQPFPYTLRPVGPCQGFVQRTAHATPSAATTPGPRGPMPTAHPAAPSAADVFGGQPGYSADTSFGSLGGQAGGYGVEQQAQQPQQQHYGQPQQQQYGYDAMAGVPSHAAPHMQAPVYAPAMAAPHQQQQQQHFAPPSTAFVAPQLQQQQQQPVMGAMGMYGGGPQQGPAQQPRGPTPVAAAGMAAPMAAHHAPQLSGGAQPMPRQQVGWQPGPAPPAPAPQQQHAMPPTAGYLPQAAMPPTPHTAAPVQPMMAAPMKAAPPGPMQAPLPADFYSSLDVMRALIPMLHGSAQLNAVEQKQLVEAGQSLDTVASRGASGMLKAEVVAKLMELSAALGAYDFKKALKLQAELATLDWNSTKEWVRGLRNLVAVCATKSGMRA